MSNFPIFSVLGIEIEYMLVDKTTLNIQPKADLILSSLAGELVNEVALGDIAISNELVMHVLELKNNGPRSPNEPLAEQFQKAIGTLQQALDPHNLLLLPTGAHPWMDPLQETQRWPHGNNERYRQFDAIFNCQGHGWANLQSMHVNLPYSTAEEFYQLHNVIRLILPLLPALAASTPFLDGKATGLIDSRLYFYSNNQRRIPSIAGQIIPEFIRHEEEYYATILNPMYEDIRPFDPEGVLQYPWLNSRAAIVKPEQKAIEIRILDSQECVDADIAIALVIHAVLQHWQNNSDYYLDYPVDTKRLKYVLDETIVNGLSTVVDDATLMHQWQLPQRRMPLYELWSLLIEKVSSTLPPPQQRALEHILSQGNLSERLLRAAGAHTDRPTLAKIYKQLAYCLFSNQQFTPT